MKLVYLLTTADAMAGTERAIASQTTSLAAAGYDIRVASVYRSGNGTSFDYGVPVEYISDIANASGLPSILVPTEWDNQFCADVDRRILDYLKSLTGVDIILASTPALGMLAALGAPEGVRIISQDHRATATRGETAEPLLRFAYQMDAIVSLVPDNTEWLKNALGLNAPILADIPNSLPDIGRPVSSLNQKVIMTAGRLVWSKGFQDVIGAFASVSKDFPEWRLRIYGEGPYRNSLISRIRNLGVADRVEIIEPTAQLEVEWSRASIAALASKFEGFSLVLSEAAGAGLPLVAFDAENGPRSIVRPGKNGFLLRPGDSTAMAEAFVLLMQDETLRKRLGAKSLEVASEFAPENIRRRWISLFDSVMAQPQSARERIVHKATNEKSLVALSDSAVALPAWNSADERSGYGSSSEQHQTLVPVVVDGRQVTKQGAHELNREYFAAAFANTKLIGRTLRDSVGKEFVVMRKDAVEEFLATARDLFRHDDSVEIRLYARSLRLDVDGRAWLAGFEDIEAARVTKALLFRNYVTEEGDRSVGFFGAISVDFIEPDSARNELMRVGRRNVEVDLLTSEQLNQSLFEPWSPVRGRPIFGSVKFPIDIVYTWVDGDDPEWRQKKLQAQGNATAQVSDLASGEMRYLNRNELKYSLRSVQEFAPWVRKIFIVTDAQKPEWLIEHDALQVIYHTEIFPDVTNLPVFNSHAIEACIHRIPGLSEHFLYLNDDGFFARPVTPEKFFTQAGQPKVFMSPTKINNLGDSGEPHELAAYNNRKIIERDYGVTITQSMLHAPYAHRVSTLKKIESIYPDVLATTRASKFRSAQDVSLLSSFAQYFGLCEGDAVLGELAVNFVGLGREETVDRLSRIRPEALDFFAFGEGDEDPDPQFTQDLAVDFMERILPDRSRWER